MSMSVTECHTTLEADSCAGSGGRCVLVFAAQVVHNGRLLKRTRPYRAGLVPCLPA